MSVLCIDGYKGRTSCFSHQSKRSCNSSIPPAFNLLVASMSIVALRTE